MKSIGFVGQMDNNGIVLCISRLIASFGYKTLLIDATSTQKTRYTVQRPIEMSKLEQYITSYDSVEVAVGFSNMLEIKKYMLSNGEDFNDFEYVIINTDREEMCEEFDIKNANKIFFTSTFDLYDLKRGVELLKYVCATKRREDTSATLNVNKILMYTEIKSQGNVYINTLTKDLPVSWEGEDITLSYDDGDLSAFIQNQYTNKIEFKNISRQTKEGIAEAVIRITGEPKDRVTKALKNVEKNSAFSRR